MPHRRLIVANWKMNGTAADLTEVARIAAVAAQADEVDVTLCLPATLIARAAALAPRLMLGGQDCHAADHGPHTGCISAAMLRDAGAALTIVGHSERRAHQGETDADARAKALAARRAGLCAIVCIGETEAERTAGEAEARVLARLQGSLPDEADGDWLTLSYEPLWAIGTGKVPTGAEIAAMHGTIRRALHARFGARGGTIRIIYGGSMNAANAAAILAIPDVDGGLIGGASLSADSFGGIVAAAAQRGG